MRKMPAYSAILVPGGGVREGGVLPSWARCRLDRALQLERGEYIVTLSAGTTHRPPPLDAHGFPIFESVAAAKYLIEAGIPATRILTETHSYDTIGNAFFSRVIHADPRGLRRLLVITSDFHLPRTRAAFNWIYSLRPTAIAYELDFEGVPDPAMSPDLLQDRQAKERQGMSRLEEIAGRITSLAECHRWLFTGHNAYNSLGTAFRERNVSPRILDSY